MLLFNDVNLCAILITLREDDRCLHVALLYDIRYKCQLNLSIREQPLLTALYVFGMGWVGTRPFQQCCQICYFSAKFGYFSIWLAGKIRVWRVADLLAIFAIYGWNIWRIFPQD